MRYLLDTCVFLWVSQQPKLVSKAAMAVINDPQNELFVSDISVWEVTMKHAAGKLPMPAAPRLWIPEKFEHHSFGRLALTSEAIYRSGELPMIHADPFDRLLAAQAMEEGLTLLSPDVPLSMLGASRLW